ncbi:MAG TPA: hypothetical protein VFG35_30980 [Actinoplanes sp.]|nr:hypothetical protein [Actinoplanes sp.]
MMHYGYGMGPGLNLIVFAVVLPTLLIAIGLITTWIQRQPSAPPPTDPIPDAERLLAERLARSEIDSEEYEQRLHALHAARR